jgi:hypothetical protein
MPDTPSITIIKRFTFRGKDEEWSNTYHFTGTTPTGDAGWKTLADAVIASERTCYTQLHKVVRAYGYEAGNEHAVAAIYYDQAPLSPLPGTLTYSNTDGSVQAGDAALWLRSNTGIRGSNGKYRYLRKYFHGVITDTNGVVAAIQKTPVLAHGAKLTDGSLPGGFKWCAPQGALGGACSVSNYATTRTLKRRGKRPSS